MLRVHRSDRVVAAALALLAAGVSGCAAGATSAGSPHAPSNVTLDPAVDPVRARLSLEQIEPPIEAPQRSDALEPVSGRAARRMAAARDLIAEQRFTEAGLKLEEALRYDPNHPEIHRALAQLHWQAGNVERARMHATRALDVHLDDAVSHFLLGRCHARSGDLASAITAYRTSLASSDFGEDVEAAALCHYHLAEALAAEGYLEASLTQYEAYERKARDLDVHLGDSELVALLRSERGSAGKPRSVVLEKLGRFSEAAEALTPLVAASEDDPQLGLRCARLWMRAGRFDRALAAARALPSGDDAIFELLSEIHRQAGHPEGIIDDLRKRLAARPDDPRRVLNLADAYMRLARGKEARRELERYLSRHESADVVRTRLADLHIESSAWSEVVRVCAEGIEREPNRTGAYEAKVLSLVSNEEALAQLLGPPRADESPASLYLRGKLALESGRIAQAERFLAQCHRADASFVPARVGLGAVYLSSYRYEDALRIAARAAEGVAEDARLEALLAKVYERLDDLERAQEHFKASLQLNRADAPTMFALADIHRRSGHVLQAQRQLRVLLAQDPDYEAAREMLLLLYLTKGKLEAASEQLDHLKTRSASATTIARCQAVVSLVQDRDPVAYRSALTQAMEQGEPNADTWIAIAETYGALEQEQTRAAYQHALALEPDNEKALLGLIHTEQRLLAFEEAARRQKALLPRRPHRHSWRHNLIELYRILHDYDAALALAREQAARKDIEEPTRTAYRLEWLNTLQLAGQEQEALEWLRTWAQAESDNTHWSVRLAEGYLLYDQPEPAVEIYERLFRLAPDDLSLLGRLIDALEEAGLHDRACQHALDWLHDDPENDQGLALLISVLASADRIDDALELARNNLLRTQGRERFQDVTISLLSLGERYDECVEWIETLLDEAIASIRRFHAPPDRRKARRLFPEQIMQRPNEPFSIEGLHGRTTRLRGALARALVLAGDYRKAERRLTSWLDATRDPEARFVYLALLAACQREQDREADAGATLVRALAIQPDNIGLNNDIAYGWIDRGIRLDEAEVMIRYALSRSPRVPAYLDTYGWLMYKKGAFAEAKKWLLRAAGTPGRQDAVILDHLGDACWRLGESSEAIKHWQAGVEAVQAIPEDELDTGDERRVRDTIGEKFGQAQAGQAPSIAPIAAEPKSAFEP